MCSTLRRWFAHRLLCLRCDLANGREERLRHVVLGDECLRSGLSRQAASLGVAIEAEDDDLAARQVLSKCASRRDAVDALEGARPSR